MKRKANKAVSYSKSFKRLVINDIVSGGISMTLFSQLVSTVIPAEAGIQIAAPQSVIKNGFQPSLE